MARIKQTAESASRKTVRGGAELKKAALEKARRKEALKSAPEKKPRARAVKAAAAAAAAAVHETAEKATRRAHAGTVATREMMALQSEYNRCIPRAAIARVIRDIASEMSPDCMFTKAAMEVLHEVTEAFGTQFFQAAQTIAIGGGSVSKAGRFKCRKSVGPEAMRAYRLLLAQINPSHPVASLGNAVKGAPFYLCQPRSAVGSNMLESDWRMWKKRRAWRNKGLDAAAEETRYLAARRAKFERLRALLKKKRDEKKKQRKSAATGAVETAAAAVDAPEDAPVTTAPAKSTKTAAAAAIAAAGTDDNDDDAVLA